MDEIDRFEDREEAGKALADRLSQYRGQDAVVLALPRGGLPVGAEIARALALPLDLVFVRKLGTPHNPELAMGAIAGPQGEVVVRNPDVFRAAGCEEAEFTRIAEREKAEILRRREAYGAPDLPLQGKIAIVVDDGMATGATMRAALRAVRQSGPEKTICAIPVASRSALEEMRGEADEVICPLVPSHLYAVGAHYIHFDQVPDSEVTAILARARSEASSAENPAK
ncbi:phosphoribosyltransferase [Thioclava atlantica]|uniref:Phosphoribosyltransferase n=1 Tax=Thioclava atlantica TaxID=1317124 RepID=A0A085U0D4_9RHOB|nr:phosphoribosyltransferase family protein [Thioclava atlantica]KFE36431.1 phosphoribosyltransferase [Thioclava atlantica]